MMVIHDMCVSNVDVNVFETSAIANNDPTNSTMTNLIEEQVIERRREWPTIWKKSGNCIKHAQVHNLAHIKHTYSYTYIHPCIVFTYMCTMIMDFDVQCSVANDVYTKNRATRTALYLSHLIEHNLKMGVRPIFRCRSYCHTFSARSWLDIFFSVFLFFFHFIVYPLFYVYILYIHIVLLSIHINFTVLHRVFYYTLDASWFAFFSSTI